MTTNNVTHVTQPLSPTASPADFMTSEEVMELFQIKRSALQRIVRDGLLIPRGPSVRNFFLRSEVMELLLKPKTLY